MKGSFFIIPDQSHLFMFSGLNELNSILKQIEDHVRNECKEQDIQLIRLRAYFNTTINQGYIDYETKYFDDDFELRDLEVGLGLYIHKLSFIT